MIENVPSASLPLLVRPAVSAGLRPALVDFSGSSQDLDLDVFFDSGQNQPAESGGESSEECAAFGGFDASAGFDGTASAHRAERTAVQDDDFGASDVYTNTGDFNGTGDEDGSSESGDDSGRDGTRLDVMSLGMKIVPMQAVPDGRGWAYCVSGNENCSHAGRTGRARLDAVPDENAGELTATAHRRSRAVNAGDFNDFASRACGTAASRACEDVGADDHESVDDEQHNPGPGPWASGYVFPSDGVDDEQLNPGLPNAAQLSFNAQLSAARARFRAQLDLVAEGKMSADEASRSMGALGPVLDRALTEPEDATRNARLSAARARVRTRTEPADDRGWKPVAGELFAARVRAWERSREPTPSWSDDTRPAQTTRTLHMAQAFGVGDIVRDFLSKPDDPNDPLVTRALSKP